MAVEVACNKQECLKESVECLQSIVACLIHLTGMDQNKTEMPNKGRPTQTPIPDALLQAIDAIDRAHGDLELVEKWLHQVRALTGVSD